MIFLEAKKDIKKEKGGFCSEKATYAGQIWAIDFIHDSLEDGRSFRIFNLIDIYSQKSI